MVLPQCLVSNGQFCTACHDLCESAKLVCILLLVCAGTHHQALHEARKCLFLTGHDRLPGYQSQPDALFHDVAEAQSLIEACAVHLQRLLNVWFPLWQLVFQPAIGVLMLGAVSMPPYLFLSLSCPICRGLHFHTNFCDSGLQRERFSWSHACLSLI